MAIGSSVEADVLASFPSPEQVEKVREKSRGSKIWWDITTLADVCKKRQGRQLAAALLITGEWGSGKTMFSYELSDAIDVNFNLRRNIFLDIDPREIAKKIDKLDINPAPVLDEAIVSLYNQNWADRRQQAFYKYINAALRKEKQGILIMNIPSIFDLRGSFLRGQVTMWVHLISPGIGVIMLKNPGPFPDPFFRKELLDRWLKFARRDKLTVEDQYSLDFQMKVYSSHRMSFFRFISFERMSDQAYNNYLSYYSEHKASIREELFRDDWADRGAQRASYYLKKLDKEDGGHTQAFIRQWKCGCTFDSEGNRTPCAMHKPHGLRYQGQMRRLAKEAEKAEVANGPTATS